MGSLNRRRRLAGLLFCIAVAPFPLRGHAQTSTPASPVTLQAQAGSQQLGATVTKYCATCHNDRLRTAGLVLDQDAIDHVTANAERWEKVIRKLQARSMPPPGAPRPEPAVYDALKGYLETELDRAATAAPNAGKLPLLHRLTRTEYQNAVRDLLALDALPKAMEYSMLLPQDNAMSGFDNIADLLFVSPTAMESYLGAAEKISRLAVGDPSAPLMISTYRMPDEQPQTSRADAARPYGTRGGLAINTHLPLDGEYAIAVTFTGNSSEEQKLEITVDGERVRLETLFGGADGGRGGGEPLEVRIPAKAGPRAIGVAFLERSELRDEQVLRPRLRGAGPALALDRDHQRSV